MKNQEIAAIFERMGRLLEIKGENVFKVRAYDRAAENLRLNGEDVETLRRENRLADIGGVGKALEEKIGEYCDTGKVSAYEDLIREIPESVLELVEVPSVGPKKAKLFFDRLHVRSLGDLQRAIEAGRLAGLPGIQDKTIVNILKGIETVRAGRQRMDLATATRAAEDFVTALRKLKEVKRIAVAGSLRRLKETVRDIDILIVSSNPRKVMSVFVHLPTVGQINAYGETKSSVLTKDNVQVDVRVVATEEFGAALLYFTGSKSFNVRLRQIAVQKGMKINEYGIFATAGGTEKKTAGRTEEECFKVLGFPYVPPQLREDIGEHELFSGGRPAIPRLTDVKDIRGDLHVHSLWSDGHDKIEALARVARARGYRYIGISDHSERLKVAGGLSAGALKKKRAEIAAVARKYPDVKILFGTEVEIDTEGNLDYNDTILGSFDIVIAAVHSGFEQSRARLTQRLVKACRNPRVHVLAHPFGNHFGKRQPMDIDFHEVCRTAAATNTLLEINAFPVRMDLDAPHVYYARKQGVRFVINTDAHRVDHLDFMKFGVAVAQRGWLTADRVVNTFPLGKFLKTLKGKGHRSS